MSGRRRQPAPTRIRACSRASRRSPRRTADTVVIKMKNPEPEPAVPARAGASFDRRAEERSHQRHQPGWHRAVHGCRLGQGFVDHAEQMAGIPQCGGDQAQQGRDPLHQRPVGAGGVTAVWRRRCVPARGRRAQPRSIQGRPEICRSRSEVRVVQDHRRHLTTRRSRSTMCGFAARCSPRLTAKPMIEGAVDGFGVPIGSFLHAGLAGLHRHDRHQSASISRKAKLLARGRRDHARSEVSLKLPPPAYARQGGEVLAAQLAKVGITAKDREFGMGASGYRGVQHHRSHKLRSHHCLRMSSRSTS